MRVAILFYFCGVTLALLFPAAVLAAHALACCIVVLVCAATPRLRWLAALLGGCLWASLHVANFTNGGPGWRAGERLTQISGTVTTFPAMQNGLWRFEFAPKQDARAPFPPAPASKVALVGTFAGGAPRLGQWCHFYARLRQVHGLANPGAPDVERAHVARRITANGRIIAHPANVCFSIAPWFAVSELRNLISERIDEAVAAPAAAAAIKALVVADRSALKPEQWDRMRDTGTSHLLAISGLHISLCAMWVFIALRAAFVVQTLWRQGYRAARPAWWGALLAAAGYAALAGFGIPVQRALCMVVGVAWAALAGRPLFSFDNLLAAFCILTLYDPFVLLAEGMWLSFCAVGVLVVVARSERGSASWVRRAWRTHWLLAFGLMPLTALLFGAVPLAAPIANFIAVPWCSVFVVPLVLVGSVLSAFSDGAATVIWNMAAQLWLLLERALAVLAQFDWQLSTLALVSGATIAPIVVAMVLCTLPRAMPGRTLALILAGAVVLAGHPRLDSGELEIRVIDVGQGLAVLVQTRAHALLYDTGPSWWGREDDAGARVVVPFLQRRGINALDAVVVSHADSDHAGGLAAVLDAVRAQAVLAPAQSAIAAAFKPCLAGRHWRWDGVDFMWLHPRANGRGTRNNLSCVLAVKSPYGAVLLSGDIEQDGERELLRRHGAGLAADVLIVPHHGSKTSSTPAFLAAVAPRFALIAAGFNNRYGLPHDEVTSRYRERGVTVFTSADDGAITAAFTATGLHVVRERERRVGFWTVPPAASD